MHATGFANFNTSISQIHNHPTSTTMILSPPYLKTIIKHQTYLSIQFTQKKVSHIFNTKYINIKQITMLLKTLKIIKWSMRDQIVSLKQIHHRALKDLSEALDQKLSRSKDISEALWAKTIKLKRYKWSTMSKNYQAQKI